MARSFHQNLAHLVFSTKDRRPLIDSAVEPDLFAYLGGIIRNLDGTALAVNGMADHVHILARTPKSITASDFMRDLKANSSRWMNSTASSQSGFAWQGGYGWFSVSSSKVDQVRAYIARQKEHHRTKTFKEEFVEFLDAHDIEYDERFIWE